MRTHYSETDIRTVILDAAEKLIERYGYKKTTMEEIAREAGTGKGTLYLYFTNKEDLAFSILDRDTARLHSKLKEISNSADGSVERIRCMLIVRVLERFDSVQRYTLSLDDLFSSLRVQLLQRRGKYIEEEAHIISKAMEEGIQEGAIICQNAYLTSQLLLMATSSLLPYNLSAEELGVRDDVLSKTRQIVDLMLFGLLSNQKRKSYRSESLTNNVLSVYPPQMENNSISHNAIKHTDGE